MPDTNTPIIGQEESNMGRPNVTEEQKKEMVQKVEPYLKSGLSVRKALKEAGIPRSTFYAIMDRDDDFKDQIERFTQFISIILNNALVKQLQDITHKQANGNALTKEELDFLKWFATNSNSTKEEFGERKEIGIVDPEAEFQRSKTLMQELSGDDDDYENKA